ncbi:MAG: peptide/nickel transport system substrate-binding protein [Thermoleophilaceae bacterium]|nr:peptide/nickel transport system substrate-binding protein [Thermoleophilaceae bacterium]
MRRFAFTVIAALAVLALTVAGCGSSGKAKQGGTVTILDTEGGVDSLDPGYWYYQTDYKELGPTQRQLYGWKPTETKPTLDLATALPKASDGGKTLTVKIQPGIKYSAPLQTRTVKAADIKYAIERCFLPQVGNGYASLYYSDIVGADAVKSGKTTELSGITTPDDTTLVIKTTKPAGVLTSAGALGMPCTVPVPKDYAQKYDKGKTSTYGEHEVFTGPYMVVNDGKGKITGYEAGKRLSLVRNPSWDKKTDFRPAYFDRIEVKGGFDATVAARKTLTGKAMIGGDYAAPPVAVLKSALSSRKDQVSIEPSGGNRYISLDTKVKPLDNVNVRRAISAAIDRTALRQTRGGPTLGTPATHFIAPGTGGFEAAGAEKGPGFDFTANPKSDLAVAAKYLKKAGYASGKYNGPPLLTVADDASPAKETAEAFQSEVEQIGIKLKLREVPHATMLAKFCQVPKAAVAICPNLGWGADFFAPQSMIAPLFHGKNIVPSGNVNSAQVNDPKLNAQIDKAIALTDPAAADKAWGELDKQVTDQSYFIAWLWDNNIGLESSDVNGVPSKFNSGEWDLAFSSLKK